MSEDPRTTTDGLAGDPCDRPPNRAERYPDDGFGGDELAAVLELGRTALDCASGALVRVGDDGWTVRTAVTEDGSSGFAVSDRRVGTAVRNSDATVETGDGASAGWFAGRRVTVDGDPFGVVCFTDEAAAGRDRATAREVVERVADLVAGELEEFDDWSDRALTETLLQTVPDVLYAFSADGRPVQWNDHLEGVTGYGPADIATMGPLDFVAAEDRDRVTESLREVDRESVPDAVEADLVTRDGKRVPYEFNGAPITDEDGDVVGFAGVGRDVSDYRDHEETLTALHDVTRELLPLESEEAICERVVAATTDLLDIEVVGAFLFDEAANVLEPVAQNAGADAVVDEVPTFGPGEGVAWRAFMRGEVAVFDDVRAAEAVYNPETAVRSELFVPLGEHGILLAGSTAVGAFDDRTVELADLLAANAEAALNNVDRKRELAARDAELSRQHRRLERLNEVNERVRRIGHALVGVDTPAEVADLVCARLAAVDRFSLVALSARDGADGDLTTRATAGRGDGYFEAVETAEDLADGEGGDPTRRAARTDEPVVVDRVASDFRGAPWRRAALSRDFRSVAAFPLVHDGIPHGVLTVCADAPGTFDEETATVLSELADMVAEATGIAKRRRAASTGDGVELVVRVDPWPDPVGPLADAVGEAVTVTRAIPAADDACLLYAETAADTDAVTDALATTAGVASGRVVSASGDRTRFEVTTVDRTAADAVRAGGGRVVRLTLADGHARLVARVPPETDVRDLVERVGGDHEASVLAQRTDPATAEADPLDALTDRQRAALLAAYDAGFFEWPRRSSGEEVAADLSVAQPTFAEHLRRAQANLFDSLFEG
ncbi:PAS sensor protein [Halosimplex carlsbadense 2-9-1]|uniref:PAS sensor protein n=1 Tax=Halosimplex carlsbadense 2-9-1 TaxID=797114 RepID=M0CXS7_9EURY|nr:GAF domain-containing protein [Halosimplex carlsbadense]ELZ27438.1 PAS sensor protein [Halosimplex carlsbadense 2-9-1]